MPIRIIKTVYAGVRKAAIQASWVTAYIQERIKKRPVKNRSSLPGDKSGCAGGTGAEYVLWRHMARRRVGNRKERRNTVTMRVPQVIVSRPIASEGTQKNDRILPIVWCRVTRPTVLVGSIGSLSPRSTLVGQDGSDSPLGCHSLPSYSRPIALRRNTKKRPDTSDRLVSGDKTDCTGGVYRARTYDLHDVKCAQEVCQRRSSEHKYHFGYR